MRRIDESDAPEHVSGSGRLQRANPHRPPRPVQYLTAALLFTLCAACSQGAPDGATCARDDDCLASCTLFVDDGVSAVGRADDMTAVLVCGPAREETGSGLCEAPEDCGRGLCALSGVCLVSCVSDADCAEGSCRSIRIWRSPLTTARVDACATTYSVPPRVTATRVEMTLEATGAAPLVSAVDVPAMGEAPLQLFAVLDPQPYPDGLRAGGVEALLERDSGQWVFLNRQAYEAGLWERTPVPTLTRPAPRLSSRGPYWLYLEREADVAVEVVQMRAQDEGEVLDLDFFLVTAEPDTRARIERALPEMGSILATAGITLGDVRFHALPTSVRMLGVIRSIDDGWPEDAAELLRTTAALSRPTVPVFLIQWSDDGRVGYSPGIPGPQGIFGTDGSGVFVATDVIDDDALAATIVHEMGHFFGLEHTTSQDGLFHDPFGDTPECVDSNGDSVASIGECGAGAENVMFWAIGGSTLSPSQAAVLRRAFVLR